MPTELSAGPVVLRRAQENDAAAVTEAVEASLDYLRPWMPWATASAATLAVQRERCRRVEELWAKGTDYIYHTWLPDGPLAGCVGAHRRIGPGGIEIGYWTHATHAGSGYATAAVRVLTPHLLRLPDVDRVEIHCDELNVRSAAIPQRLGYRLDRIEDRDPQAPAESRRLMIWMTP
ncbi:GNAT family N-acetyltransferase [Haloechinothrix halophila]|uniref:GNAT family N-acetyltransferase n=1 Tax=Haloechinothrix halophila TaxID=1069073 RepID=UPI0005519D45|nr:GNAT family N-acetyltransferase [Haloechinothrix halophila]